MTMPTLASAESVTITWLLSLQVVTTATTQVGTKLSGDTWPQIRVTRTGGTVNEDPWYDNPRVQVEFWGSGPDDANPVDDATIDQLARDVAAKVPYMRGNLGGYVTSSLVSLGPFPSADPTTNRYRQLIEITLEVE